MGCHGSRNGIHGTSWVSSRAALVYADVRNSE